METHPLEPIKKLDPGFFDFVEQSRERALKDGALSAKTKYLIAMVLDAAHGAVGGVASLARQAANFISGVGSVYTASFGLAEVFK